MKEDRSSRATRNAFFSLFGPFSVANFLLLLMFLVLLVFRPSGYDSSTYWALALMAFLGISALVVVIVGARGGLKRLTASAKEDRRRIAAGLPLDPEDQE
jgi:O-antigen/teichoic acid export membrane protein